MSEAKEAKAKTATKKTTKTTATKTDAVKKVAKTQTKKTTKKVEETKTEQKAKTRKKLEPIAVTVETKPSILFVGSEATPFIKTGGLADVLGSLPISLAEDNTLDVRVILPLYGTMEEGYKTHLTYVTNFNVPVGWRNQYCGLFYYKHKNVTFYFIDNEYYFKRENLYGFFDDGERFAFFSRAVLEVMAHLDYYPNVMHCHDWQSALAVIYLKTIYKDRPAYQQIRSVFTIHNIEYQGRYSHDEIGELFGLDSIYIPALDYNYDLNLMKGALVFADQVTTVSATYAKEILTSDYACGLQYAVNDAKNKLTGITNGIDVKTFNPQLDPVLIKNYSADDLSGKLECKKNLQNLLNLPEREDVPVIAMISRLVNHKGLDLVRQVLDKILAHDVQVVILGKGDREYENYFKYMSEVYSDKMRAIIAYNKDLSSKIYAGADLFLMPSRSEPCGLSQMIAARYGAVPIVRRTGGLRDTITPFNTTRQGGNGFAFDLYDAQGMLVVIEDAINTFKDKPVFNAIVKEAMTTDFSWKKSAKEYEQLYLKLIH